MLCSDRRIKNLEQFACELFYTRTIRVSARYRMLIHFTLYMCSVVHRTKYYFFMLVTVDNYVVCLVVKLSRCIWMPSSLC